MKMWKKEGAALVPTAAQRILRALAVLMVCAAAIAVIWLIDADRPMKIIGTAAVALTGVLAVIDQAGNDRQ